MAKISEDDSNKNSNTGLDPNTKKVNQFTQTSDEGLPSSSQEEARVRHSSTVQNEASNVEIQGSDKENKKKGFLRRVFQRITKHKGRYIGIGIAAGIVGAATGGLGLPAAIAVGAGVAFAVAVAPEILTPIKNLIKTMWDKTRSYIRNRQQTSQQEKERREVQEKTNLLKDDPKKTNPSPPNMSKAPTSKTPENTF